MKKWILAACIFLAILISFFYKSDIPADTVKKKYSNATSRFLPLMGMQVHYRIEGNPLDTLPLVLIHGTSSSLHTWDSLAARLQSYKKIIRMDLPAFGLTGPHENSSYSIRFYEHFLDSFLTSLHIDACILGGNSLGGGIAWNQALYDPRRIKGLLLLNSVGYPRTNEKGNIGFKLASMPLAGPLLSKFTPKMLIRKSIEDVYANDNKITDPLIDRYYDLLLREGNRKAVLDLFRQGNEWKPEKIEDIHVPTLIVWGQEDQLIDVKNAYRFNKDIKGSTLLIVPQSGHVPMEETPDVIAVAIKQWIDTSSFDMK